MSGGTNGVHDELRAWLQTWDSHVRARDFESARALFHAEVIGFGTHMRLVRGLDHLEHEQWRNVWPTIDGFRFQVDQLETGASNDGLLAWAVVPWSSTGFHEDGRPFERPGRATVLFAREHWNEPWLATHTHISLAPGTPQRSHGRLAGDQRN